MIDQVRARVSEQLARADGVPLDGVVALRQTVGEWGHPVGTSPYLFHKGDDLSQLVLAPRYPLAPVVSLLHKKRPQVRIGVVAQACDIRALVEMAKRQQVDPDRLVILGVACTAKEAQACHCADPVPDVEHWPAAETIGTPAEGAPPNPIVAEYAKMSQAERRSFWEQQFRKCIKCYGCRNICPECFCVSCALEDPLWVEPGVLAPPFPTYHLIRAMHMSGRCVACRQCELVCPAHIPLTILHDLVRQDVKNLLAYVPGTDLNAKPPFSLTLDQEQPHAGRD